MFSGVFGGSDLYAVEFDDEVLSLTIANTIATGGTSSKWIAIDVCSPAYVVYIKKIAKDGFSRNENKIFMLAMGPNMTVTPLLTTQTLSTWQA